MLKSEVYRNSAGGFESSNIVTGTKRSHGLPKIDNTSHFEFGRSLKLLANRLITYLRIMKNTDRWLQFEDRLEVVFPRDIKIYHPLSGESRVLYPVSEKEAQEFWEHINFYSQRKEVCYED